MRKELYNKLKDSLSRILTNGEEFIILLNQSEDDPNTGESAHPVKEMDKDWKPAIRHIDLWNHNVEFIDQETPWERPAVFIEFEPIHWVSIVPGLQYRSEGRVKLHIVTDWTDDVSGIKMLDLPEAIQAALYGLEGDSFTDLTLAESHTNHNHEDIVENIEVYSFVTFRNINQI